MGAMSHRHVPIMMGPQTLEEQRTQGVVAMIQKGAMTAAETPVVVAEKVVTAMTGVAMEKAEATEREGVMAKAAAVEKAMVEEKEKNKACS